MNYGELKTKILSDAHRPDLTSEVDSFVEQCEGMIRRDLRGYLLNTTLTDADRVSDGLYNVPGRLLEVRSIKLQGRQGDGIQRVAPDAIRRLDTTADVVQYCQNGDSTVEFRGVPGTAEIFDLLYYGTPAPFTTGSDENDLLTDHLSLYLSGSLFWLYMHTQDLELASTNLDIFNGVIDTLNEQIARQIGGANITPAYNFAGGSTY